MIKKYFSVLIILVLLFTSFPIKAFSVSLGISASSAVVMVAQTGKVLYEHNAHVKRSMASTTKIMTALLLLENADLKKEIVVKKDELNVEGTSMGLLPGDRVTFEGLACGMLLQSGNDAANVTAYRIGSTLEGFAKLMNERAKEIGMNNTNFVTPSGLDDDEHYSTAYDMALLGSTAIKNADFRNISSQKQMAVFYGNPPYRRTLTNHNKLLRYYNGCIGLKTGFTKKSGRCLVSAAERDGIVLVAVTLNAPNDWNDHKVMLDYGFSKVKNHQIDSENDNLSLKVVGGKKSNISISLKNSAEVDVNTDMPAVKSEYLLDKFVYAPVKKGDTVGKIVYYVDSKKIAEVFIQSDETVQIKKVEKKLTRWQKFVTFIKGIFKK